MIEHSVVEATRAGDPFVAASEAEERECFYCAGSGYHFLGSIDGDTGEEVIEAYPCRRCVEAEEGRDGR